jgi:DUF4097 and DUF4098 domain-containing protein YvlB
MNKGITTIILMMAFAVVPALGQQNPRPPREAESQRERRAPRPDAPARTPQPEPPGAPGQQLEGSKIEVGQVTLKLARGGKLSVSNTSGPITIVGSDRDTIEAKASDGSEPVGIRVYQSPARPVVVLSISSVEGRRFSGEARLDVKVPRYADVEIVDSRDGDIEVSEVDGSVAIGSRSGAVKVSRVGSLEIRTQQGEINAKEIKGAFSARTTHGEITVQTVGGPVEVATTHGEVTVQNAAGDVRVNSSSSEINIRCAKGRVEAQTASGSITLAGIDGDVDASTASGEITFKGSIRADGRYRLKSLSGEVQMAIQENPPGFTATLVTYNGEIETVFRLKISSPMSGGPINRRVTGVYGDGKAQVALDSFNGAVRIVKLGADAAKQQCK